MIWRTPPAVTVDVPDGEGFIEVVGDASGSMLLLAGDPFAVGGSDGSGSVGMLAGLAGAKAPTPAEVKSLVDWLGAPGLKTVGHSASAEPPDPGRLRPLLGLLAPGRYRLTAHIPHKVRIVDPAKQVVWWHEEDAEVVLVLTDRVRSSPTVHQYRRQINEGRSWPAVIALFPSLDAEIGYLLDGHHKLAAYQQAGYDPMVVAIRPELPFRPRLSDLHRIRSIEVRGPVDEMRWLVSQQGPWAK